MREIKRAKDAASNFRTKPLVDTVIGFRGAVEA